MVGVCVCEYVVFKRLESHEDPPGEWLVVVVVVRSERFEISDEHGAAVRSGPVLSCSSTRRSRSGTPLRPFRNHESSAAPAWRCRSWLGIDRCCSFDRLGTE